MIDAVITSDDVILTQQLRVAQIPYNAPESKIANGRTFRAGIQSHVERYPIQIRRDLRDASQAAGSRIVRGGLALQWGTVERLRGQYDWTMSDRLVAEYSKDGFAINTAIRGTPAWAKALPEDEQLKALGAFAGAAAARYRGKVDYYEYGNEFDIKAEPSAETLAAILKAIYGPIHAGDPTARVILGGMACPDSTRSANTRVRKGFHEKVMTLAKGYYDLHAVHIHSPITTYIPKTDYLLTWRKQLGIDAPWVANETAVTVETVGEIPAARMVWQKILYAWSRGSADYIWYNDYATTRVDGHREGGYGLLDDAFRPRATFAAFAAFQRLFSACQFERIIHHGANSEILLFRRGKDIVLTGWNRGSGVKRSSVAFHVMTDAQMAKHVDLMGNETACSIQNQNVMWCVDENPSAIVLTPATMATISVQELRDATKTEAQIVLPDAVWGAKPNLTMRSAEQVHELYEADPRYEHRTWRGTADFSADIYIAREAGWLHVKIAIEDECHAPNANSPKEGDSVLLLFGEREILFSEGLESAICRNCTVKKMKWRVSRTASQTLYEITLPTAPIGLPSWKQYDDIPFNIRLYDADAEGLDGWMDLCPFDSPGVIIR